MDQQDHNSLQIEATPLALPHGPRAAMARLRASGLGDFVLLDSALPMAGQAEWSYIAGPARARLYTEDAAAKHGACLVAAGAVGPRRRWADAASALRELAAARPWRLRAGAELPASIGFTGGWVGVMGYDGFRPPGAPEPAAADAGQAQPAHLWLAVERVLAYHHPSGRWWQCHAPGAHDHALGRPGPAARALEAAAWDAVLAAAGSAASPPPGPWQAGPASCGLDRAAFEQGVATLREAIAEGQVLQVNLTRREERAFAGDAWALYEDLVAAHPAPFAAFLEVQHQGRRLALASVSPERFVCMDAGGALQARPIKGTAPRGRDAADDGRRRAALAASAKDRAENLMITDLLRNDLGRVAATGSVRVPELFALEPYASVWQMVSTVSARCRPGLGAVDVLEAAWPPGSMTGAPKAMAMRWIARLEPTPRGWYSGSVAYLDLRGGFDASVIIRSVVVDGGRALLQLGGGIVADSDPAAEWHETVAKGQRLVAVLDGQGRAAPRPAAQPAAA